MSRIHLARSRSLVVLVLGLATALAALPSVAYADNPAPKGVIITPPSVKPTIQISTDKQTYAPGDPIAITVTLEQSAYVYVYDIDAGGTVTLLYPNRYEPDAQVPAGKLVLPGVGYDLVIAPPEGLETLVALASPAPLSSLAPAQSIPFRKLSTTPEAFAQGLQSDLGGDSGWTSAWTQITVYQPKGTVVVDSQPRGAKILVDGKAAGVTPKSLVLAAGDRTITLEKSGYKTFKKTLTVADGASLDLDTRLETALQIPPSVSLSLTPSFLAFDLGTNSIGFEVGFAGLIGVSTAARFTGESPGAPGTMYNLGPEVSAQLRLHVALSEGISVILGGGVAIQNRTLSPVTTSGTSPAAIVIEPEIETDAYPCFFAGLGIDLPHALLFGGYDLRRGILFGAGITF